MKKAFFIFILTFSMCFVFSGCSPTGYCNILLFTDRLCEISGENISLESYSISNGSFRLVAAKDSARVLITCTENENAELKRVAVTLSKVDEGLNVSAPDGNSISLYRQKVKEAIYAFTLFDEEKSRELAEKILPLKSDDFLREGELTLDIDNFHLVYYSNKLCCRFTVTDTFLEKTQVTQKPEKADIL